MTTKDDLEIFGFGLRELEKMELAYSRLIGVFASPTHPSDSQTIELIDYLTDNHSKISDHLNKVYSLTNPQFKPKNNN